jgi:hypothetical protein
VENKYNLAKEIISRTFKDAKLVSQSSDLWQGNFSLPDELAEYYRDLGVFDLNIEGYGNPFFLPRLEKLWSYQSGYRFHGITNEPLEGWDDDWIVIADAGADPLIFSRKNGSILFDYHGQGRWNPSQLFSDLSSMVTSFLVLGEIVVNAGEEFTNENSDINESYIISAKEQLGKVLNSKIDAETLLDTFGWSY